MECRLVVLDDAGSVREGSTLPPTASAAISTALVALTTQGIGVTVVWGGNEVYFAPLRAWRNS